MKKTILHLFKAFIFLIYLSTLPMKAEIWRVNNNGSPYVQYSGHPVFNDFAFAVSSAASDDTIYVEASPVSYTTGSGVHVDKKLIIIGPGYFLDGSTGNANMQANPNTALIMDIYFDPGSENSVISGVQIGTGAGILHIRASNITVKRNYFMGRLSIDNSTAISNILVTQNYFSAQDIIHGASMASVSSSIISNNYFGAGMLLINNFQGVITQNVFVHGAIDFWGVEFYNNIVSNPTSNLVANNNDTLNIHNNVFTYAAPSFLPSPNSNTFSFPSTNIFQTGSSTDDNLHLDPLCTQCLPTGSFGYQMGVYGGAPGSEYRLSGIPEVPSIYQLYASPNILKGDTIQVTIHTRSNN